MELKRIYLLLIASLVLWLSLTPGQMFAQNQSGITSPNSGDSVSGDVIVSGTALIDPFLRYELYYKQEPSGDDAYIYFDGGTTQVTGGQLGIWRTTDLPAGTYSLRLRVVKTDGNYGEFVVSNLNLNINTEPTVTTTPTSGEPTPTPIPTETFTPAPQPTAIVGQITQPQVDGLLPTATPTPILAAGNLNTTDGTGTDGTGEGATDSNANSDQAGDALIFGEEPAASTNAEPVNTNSFTRQLGEAVAIERLRQGFVTGMRFSAILILGIAILFVGKWAFRWVWTQYR